MFKLISTTIQKANKEYHCEASDWVDNIEFDDYSLSDLKIIREARAEGFKILKGAKYIKIKSKMDGRLYVYRSRIDLNEICSKYDLYQQ